MLVLLLIVGCFQIFNPSDDDFLPKPNTKYNQTKSPIGGGMNYKNIIQEKTADFVVDSLAELRDAIEHANNGDIIFLPGDVELDLSESAPLIISKKITLASDRGLKGSNGARLFMDFFTSVSMIRVKADSVRITGLRIEGPDKERRESRDGLPRIRGIYVNGPDHIEIDNCEILGWSFSGIHLDNSVNAYVHHNFIHHNRRTGLGYGVALYANEDSSNALIEANYFTLNRHSIAGSGQLGVSYEARFNYVRENTTSHSFDMHGDHESPGSGTIYAGQEIRIHHNTFQPGNQGVVLRGKPKKGAWIYENNFIGAKQDVAVRQKYHYGNLHVYDNKFQGPKRAWYVSWDGREDWYTLKADPVGTTIDETFIGDFNGDREDDLLVRMRQDWYISYSGEGPHGHGHLKPMKFEITSNVDVLPKLLVGNFDDDARDEIVKITGGRIHIGDIKNRRWQHVQNLAAGAHSDYVRAGDFNGNRKDDLFAFDGINWKVSYEGTNEWVTVKEQESVPDQILIGRFTSRDRDDILMVQGTDLYLQSFAPDLLSKSPEIEKEKEGPFLEGDFDGDGLTDLLTLESDKVSINFSKQNEWEISRTLPSKTLNIDNIKVGDFNGDGISDLIIKDSSIW